MAEKKIICYPDPSLKKPSRIISPDDPKLDQIIRDMMDTDQITMICPFCREAAICEDTGPSTCPACKAGFEIDDRGECVFVDMDQPRMPLFGQVCTVCRQVQQDKRKACVYCGAVLSKTMH